MYICVIDQTVIQFLKPFCLDSTQENWILQNSCRSSYSGPYEKEKALIGGGKAGGGVADQPEADEISVKSGNQSNK